MAMYKDGTTAPCMKIKLTYTKPSIFESKVGGMGYIPHNCGFPVDKDDNQLRLLAQIECEKVQLEEFPKKGLLQFWILNSEDYGIGWDNQMEQNDFRVIYYPEVDKTVTEDEILSKFVKNEYDDEEYNMPVFGEFGMSFEKCDDKYVDYDDDIDDEVYQEIIGHKIGGYPYFTQSDPRNDEELEKYDFLLFQLDTDDDERGERVQWGDDGIGNFFISTEKLRNLDFSDVLYNWDCC